MTRSESARVLAERLEALSERRRERAARLLIFWAMREALTADASHTDAADMWFWQTDEAPESLVCPVVMSAETLREMLAKRVALETELAEARKPDSPPFTPPELRGLAAAGYVRRNRRA